MTDDAPFSPTDLIGDTQHRGATRGIADDRRGNAGCWVTPYAMRNAIAKRAGRTTPTVIRARTSPDQR